MFARHVCISQQCPAFIERDSPGIGEYLKSAIAGVLCSMRRLHFISEEQIKERREKERSEREIDRSMAKDMVSG